MKTVNMKTGDYGRGGYDDAGSHDDGQPKTKQERTAEIAEIAEIEKFLTEADQEAKARGGYVSDRVRLIKILLNNLKIEQFEVRG